MKKSQRKTDEVQSAAKAMESIATRHEDALPADLESAWKAWSAGVGHVDSRGMLLLKAAFEAGWEAGNAQ
jgi:hypothetical protein